MGVGPNFVDLVKVQLGAIFILRKDIRVGGWSRKWQFFLALCSENVLMYIVLRWVPVGGTKKPENTLT